MALFNRFFFSSTKRKNLGSSQSHELSQFPFEDSQVRVLLYRECDRSGRKLLFDSSAITKINLSDLEESHTSVPKVNGVTAKSNNIGVQNTNGFIEISNGFAYKHSRPNTNDIGSIGEMIFGALAMSFRGTALKVHWLESPARVLCSQVFLSPVHNNNPSAVRKSSINLSINPSIVTELGTVDSSSVNSFSMPYSVCVNENLNLLTEKSLTNPLDVPPSSTDTITSEQSRLFSLYSGGDSGYSGQDTWTTSTSSYHYSTRSSLGSVYSDPESMRKLSLESSSIFGDTSSSSCNTTSDGSFQRRISRNIYTSFENHNSMSDFIGFIGDNYHTSTNGGSDSCVSRFRPSINSPETRSNPEMIRKRGTSSDILSNPNLRYGGSKRSKLGLAVFITLTESCEKEMELFCSEHVALLEAMLCRLRSSAENAYINHKSFWQIMLHAWQNTTIWLRDLFTAPRLPCPVWLTISSGAGKNLKHIADTFINELCFLLASADTKDTNFFVSTMLTAVLTHHLGWVSTVAAVNSNPTSPLSDIVNEQNAKLIEIAKKHPYNALWAQMGDLYGAIGNPPKLSRTIIYGSEKHTVNKVLNVLTYFIRCGEIRRVVKTEIFDKEMVNKIVNDSSVEMKERNENIENQKPKIGLTRTKSCAKNMYDIPNEQALDSVEDVVDSVIIPNLHKNVMNDIPNVLAFRDSHFVQQELRIGNYLMDTGIVMSPKQKMELRKYKIKDKIRFTVTSPDNVETSVNCIPGTNIVDETGALEAIEIEPNVQQSKSAAKSTDSFNNITNTFFWSMEPIEDGLILKDRSKPQKQSEDSDNVNLLIKSKRSVSADQALSLHNNEKEEDNVLPTTKIGGLKSTKSHMRLSDLITANSVGHSQRLMWGIEPVKENISLEEQQHFELSKKIIEKERAGNSKTLPNEVVFVLGDNEALVNIKKSTEDLPKTVESSSSSMSNMITKVKTQTCNHKKHSGVKFNFEQYPQIATNYMKNKNLDLTNYDFAEKSSKLEEIFSCGPSTSSFPVGLTKLDTEEEECEYCAGIGSRVLQTPSNATELEFTSDDNYPTIAIPSTSNSSKSISFSPQVYTLVEEQKSEPIAARKDAKANEKSNPCSSLKDTVEYNIIEIPLPASKSISVKDKENHNQVKPGFTSSLLIGVSDHYIPDMVLQGTISPPQKWEIDLKQDLALAAHCASLIPSPTENVAVVADLDKWDVKVISSQTHILPYGNAASGPVGMSQLVSTMLETVLAMSSSGISAYECLSYLELKLQEMYLQSEALAAFLLATEFCSLNTVTSTLNLSANDVPLLLSVASIHSPQVTKKYGVSSR